MPPVADPRHRAGSAQNRDQLLDAGGVRHSLPGGIKAAGQPGLSTGFGEGVSSGDENRADVDVEGTANTARPWNRARGLALHQTVMIIPYYAETSPRFVALSKRTLEEVLADINAQLRVRTSGRHEWQHPSDARARGAAS